jgi:hypothetical protein
LVCWYCRRRRANPVVGFGHEVADNPCDLGWAVHIVVACRQQDGAADSGKGRGRDFAVAGRVLLERRHQLTPVIRPVAWLGQSPKRPEPATGPDPVTAVLTAGHGIAPYLQPVFF